MRQRAEPSAAAPAANDGMPTPQCGAPPNPDPLPPCPITGRPAQHRIQNIPGKLLRKLWQRGLGVDVERLFEGVDRCGLYQSTCGLVFFHPMIPGDHRFYREFYSRVGMYNYLDSQTLSRVEYQRAARHVCAGNAVLDIGCGLGRFREHIPDAEYYGLDPFAPRNADRRIIREDLDCHIDRHPSRYDVVTAFQFIEHHADPRALGEAMVRALRPGGTLILCAPLHPSAMTAIPNFLLNAMPHHLTWWNAGAFATLAATLGLEAIEIAPLPPSPHEGLIHWINRLSPCKTESIPCERYFAHRWRWHLSLGLAFALAKLAILVRHLPKDAQPINMLLVARKPV